MKTIDEIKEWIYELNERTEVYISQNLLSDSSTWFYDDKDGTIHNQNHTFFSVVGIKGKINNKEIEQPILLQNEIGYLGILCKRIDNVYYYLMQAKIEPGNINCIQISPTIQATKSNFTQKHGGNKPLYLEYFLNAQNEDIIVDQIQSEQSSRFYKKRNRNMIVEVHEEIEIDKRFCWMTLWQIKELMKERNLVNMDTRTVLSCLPFICSQYQGEIKNQYLYNSIYEKNYVQEIVQLYHEINNYKMFTEDYLEITRLDELKNWIIDNSGIRCRFEYPYEVIYCDIEIEGREVRSWTQPLFKAIGMATFGLICTIVDNQYKFLVKIRPEIGCFDKIEIGPSIQKEANEKFEDSIEKLFYKKMINEENLLFDSILSEEGGRFYHEENRNVVMLIPNDELKEIPKNYYLVSYAALNHLNLINNCLNIQLRNLLSTLEV